MMSEFVRSTYCAMTDIPKNSQVWVCRNTIRIYHKNSGMLPVHYDFKTKDDAKWFFLASYRKVRPYNYGLAYRPLIFSKIFKDVL